jgi:hypothetical protein
MDNFTKPLKAYQAIAKKQTPGLILQGSWRPGWNFGYALCSLANILVAHIEAKWGNLSERRWIYLPVWANWVIFIFLFLMPFCQTIKLQNGRGSRIYYFIGSPDVDVMFRIEAAHENAQSYHRQLSCHLVVTS